MITTTDAADPIRVFPRVKATTATKAEIHINRIRRRLISNLPIFARLTRRHPHNGHFPPTSETFFSQSGHLTKVILLLFHSIIVFVKLFQ
jgi:hypothetical protein